jgi:hypothetical protein
VRKHEADAWVDFLEGLVDGYAQTFLKRQKGIIFVFGIPIIECQRTAAEIPVLNETGMVRNPLKVGLFNRALDMSEVLPLSRLA